MIDFLPKYNAVQQLVADKTGMITPVGVETETAWQLKNVVVTFDGETYNVTFKSNMYNQEDGNYISVTGYTVVGDEQVEAFVADMLYNEEAGKWVIDRESSEFYNDGEYITAEGGPFSAAYEDGEDIHQCGGIWTYVEIPSNRDER